MLEDIVHLIYVENNNLLTLCNIIALILAIDLIFGIFNLIKGMGRAAKC